MPIDNSDFLDPDAWSNTFEYGRPPRWTVKKYHGKWSVFDRGVRCDDFDTLEEAHTWATCNAVADVLYAPGGLTCLKNLMVTR